jgi:hypothetical protein
MKIKRVPLITVILLISFQIAAQDLIYKNNGEVLKAKILDKTNQSCSYQQFGQGNSVTYFISLAIVDSIKYQDGKKEVFEKKTSDNLQPGSELNELQKADVNYRHYLIGTDVAALLFYNNIAFSYEYLPGKANLGFRASCTVNLKTSEIYNDEFYTAGMNARMCGKLGMNYYFFPPRTFRLGTGLNFITGSYNNIQYNYDEVGGYTEIKKKKNFNGITFCLFGFYNINKLLAFNLGFETPVYIHPKAMGAMLHSEILLNF